MRINLLRCSSYDADNQAMMIGQTQSWHNGNFGAMGYCIGGHLAFRAALNPNIKRQRVFMRRLTYTIIPNQPGQHSMDRLADIKGALDDLG